MPSNFDDSDFMKKLDELDKKAEELHGEHEVPFDEMYNPQFMKRHTSHETIEAFMDASGYEVEGMEDFEAIPDDEWEDHVQENTQFSSWRQMQKKAGREWTKDKMGW